VDIVLNNTEFNIMFLLTASVDIVKIRVEMLSVSRLLGFNIVISGRRNVN
jgi:hypothetical protein